MQSSGKGISGLADAINAGLPQYVSGREKLAALKDKQRDYMQTVAEARRAEELGQLDKFRELQASLTAQRANIEGVAAQLQQGDRELSARYDIAKMETNAKGQAIPSTDKLKAWYQIQYTDALRRGDTASAAAYRKTLKDFSNTLNSSEEKQEAVLNKYLMDSGDKQGAAIALYKEGNESALKQLYTPVSGMVSYEDFKARLLGSNIGGGVGGGGGENDPLALRPRI
jgi:hypothetical protein